MADQFTRVTTESWGKRLTGALGGIGGGFVLVIAAIGALAWNEGRAVTTARALTEGAGAVVSIGAEGTVPGPDGAPLDTTGMLVHVTGTLVTPPPVPLRDGLFGLPDATPDNAVRLERVVEMYQWKESSKSETRTKLGGGTETVTSYSYSKDWSGSEISSGNFADPTGHQNPPLPLKGDSFSEDRVIEAGGMQRSLDAGFVGRIGKTEALALSEGEVARIAAALGAPDRGRLAQGGAYIGYDPTRPQVGDLRISYRVARADSASVVARDTGSGFAPWTSSNGREIYMIREGAVPAAAMFDEAQKQNTLLTWGLRIGGFLAMLAGFKAIFAIFGVIADVLPVAGSLVRFGTGLIALVLTLVIAPLTIGIAWLAVRPLLGGAIIGIGLALAVGFFVLARRKAAAPPAVAA